MFQWTHITSGFNIFAEKMALHRAFGMGQTLEIAFGCGGEFVYSTTINRDF